MKTPREILLARHKAIEPKLDDIRQNIVGELNNKGAKTQSISHTPLSVFLGLPKVVWRELVWPSRRIWAGLAAVWILIVAANFSIRDHPTVKMAKSPTSGQMVMAFRQQQQLLNELLGPDDPPVAEAKKSYLPRPASERRFELMMT